MSKTIDRGSRGIATVLSAIVFNIMPTIFELTLVNFISSNWYFNNQHVAIVQYEQIVMKFLADIKYCYATFLRIREVLGQILFKMPLKYLKWPILNYKTYCQTKIVFYEFWDNFLLHSTNVWECEHKNHLPFNTERING